MAFSEAAGLCRLSVEQLAEVGGICVSGKVYDEVHRKLKIRAAKEGVRYPRPGERLDWGAGVSVQVFNSSGMEIYSFSEGELGVIQDVSTDSAGNILALSWINQGYSIVKCNFRGEPRGEIRVANLPEEFAGFSPNRMIYREGLFYLVGQEEIKIRKDPAARVTDLLKSVFGGK